MAGFPYRIQALEVALSEEGVSEVGFNNRGPRVDQYQREGTAYVGWVGFPWCAAFVSWCLKAVGFPVEMIPLRASVGFFEDYARGVGWVVSKPARGDIFCWRIDSRDNWPDHIGFVTRVVRLGPYVAFRTIEGNTSPGTGGSQDDGGGVYQRTRVIKRSRVVFLRVPGTPRRNSPAFLRRQKGKGAWKEWRTAAKRWKGYPKAASGVRPDVPQRVPRSWWHSLKGGK